jgi:hypothetical protein
LSCGEQVQVRREMLQERRQLESFAQPLLAQLVVAHPGAIRETSTSGSTP